MIFGTWRSYFVSWQIFENKVWCPVSKKRRRYFHFLLSLAYPIDRPDWALFSVAILFCCWRKLKFGPLFCPATSPRFWTFLRGGAGRGTPPSPQWGAGRPSLIFSARIQKRRQLFVTNYTQFWWIKPLFHVNITFGRVVSEFWKSPSFFRLILGYMGSHT